MKENNKIFVLLFSFIFPLSLISWAIRDILPKKLKVVETEGLLFNAVFLLAIILLKYLSMIPLLGIAFDFLFYIVIWLYILLLIAILIFKSGNVFREIPFITFYAEKLAGN